MSITINPARGMRDFLPQEKKKREQTIDTIRSVYRSFGFEEIETPMLENIDRLRSSDGGENLSMIFQILKRGLDPSTTIPPNDMVDLGLRYDLTLPLARFYASNASKLPAKLRTMQIAPVWRAERPQKGRFRQFTQCDIDIIGVADESAEVELIGVSLLALKEIGIKQVTVRLNDRRLLIALLDTFGFKPDIHARVLISVDKLDKIGVSGVASELSKKLPELIEAIDKLVDFLEQVETQRISGKVSFNDVASIIPTTIKSELMEPLRYIEENVCAGVPETDIRFDPTLVRGMGYYTGPIFEIEVEGMASSIAGGGRYDGMIGRFSNKNIPACGFSLGFERILELLPKLTENRPEKLALFYDKSIAPGVVLFNQTELVNQGYEVTAICRPKKIGKEISRLANEGFGSYVELSETNNKSVKIDNIRQIKGSSLHKK